MKVKLIKDARIIKKAGSVVDTDPVYAQRLIDLGLAIIFVEKEVKKEVKKSNKKKDEK